MNRNKYNKPTCYIVVLNLHDHMLNDTFGNQSGTKVSDEEVEDMYGKQTDDFYGWDD